MDEHGKKIKEKETALDKWKTMEREQLDSIEEEAKAMEKLANKRSLLLKKVHHPLLSHTSMILDSVTII